MRIGMVTACYEPIQNGVTRMVSLYKKHLEKAGHEVIIFTIGPKPESREAKTVVVSPGVQYGKTGYFFTSRYRVRARQLLKEMDIVHCHHPMMGLELASRYTRCPIVFTNHTRYDLYSSALTPITDNVANRLSRFVLPILLQKSDWIIAPTESMRDLLKDWGVKKPIEVIGNGIELGKYRNPIQHLDRKAFAALGDGLIGIYVGRLSAEKRVDVLLDAYSTAKSANPNLYLLIVGDGPARCELEAQADDLAIRSSVRFVGEVAFDEIPFYLALADFFVSASTSEVHPLTVMEAMAAALPIVGYRSPGMDGLVQHGNNGLLCEKGHENLARGIVELVRDRNLRLIMSRSSLDLSENFDISRTIEMSLNLYSRVLSSSQ